MSYLPPELNPKCECFLQGRNPMFCPYGHLTECHYPLDCAEAECTHYQDAEAYQEGVDEP